MALKQKIALIYIAFIVIVDIIGFFILPDVLVMQVASVGGNPTTLSKTAGLIIMMALGIAAGLGTYFMKSNDKPYKDYLVMAVLLLVHILLFAFNL